MNPLPVAKRASTLLAGAVRDRICIDFPNPLPSTLATNTAESIRIWQKAFMAQPPTANTSPAASTSATHSTETFVTDKTFADLGLKPALLEGLTKRGFKHPTRIQAALIPVALSGRDVIGQAKTGTGKTAAFGLPLLQHLDPSAAFSALVLVPTRELAIQVAKELQELGAFAKVQTVAVYGGQPITKQQPLLAKGPPIVVGTPGRVMDLAERGLLPFADFRFAILDEVDRMLDIGFRDDIRKILGKLKRVPQTIFV